MMNEKDIIKALSEIKNGTFVRVGYRTELPVRAEFKKQGISIIKVTETTLRTGVNYSNIKTVIERRSAEDYVPSSRTNNYEWVIRNKVAYNSKTGLNYAVFANSNNNNANTHFVMVTANGVVPVTVNDIVEYVQPSYFNKSNNGSNEVRYVKFANIFRIGNVVVEM